jgi:predicted TIM-barrel fold metal-dependent hydrolase
MYAGPIVDVDVHHTWGFDGGLTPYLSRAWREYAESPGRGGKIGPYMDSGFNNPHGVYRMDAFPANGGRPGSDLPLLREQVLGRFDVRRAILTHADALFLAAVAHPHFAADAARAANDFTREQWLEREPRLSGSIAISVQVPELAVAEIVRNQDDRRMVQVVLAGTVAGQPLGHPVFHPIYEAAAAADLPVAIHAFGAGGMMAPGAAAGESSYYLEYHTHGLQGMITTVTSFITNGVFEKLPSLKLVLVEPGVTWVPGYLWRFDRAYRRLRIETPWLKRSPSEYFLEHVRLSTQPLESPDDRGALLAALESYGAADLLMYASDYPHWDADDARYVASRLPESWHEKVFYENARRLYGWRDDELAASPGAAVGAVEAA